MRAKHCFIWLMLTLCLSLTACCRNREEVWDDTKSCGRHVWRGFKSLGGKHGDSRAISQRSDFYNDNDSWYEGSPIRCTPPVDYTPLPDGDMCDDIAMASITHRQPLENPGDPGSSIPGIEAFKDPAKDQRLSSIFRNIQFEYNSNLVKGEENLRTARRISEYLRKNPHSYLFVEGHCDERGPAAYNLALGSRRSNAVRSFLIQEGVNPDNLFTISYGKERPRKTSHDEEAWATNRRAEFKVYSR